MEIHRSSCALVLLLLSLDSVSPGNSTRGKTGKSKLELNQMSLLAPALCRPPGLLCVNDFIHTLGCAWLGPTHAPHANCSITGEKQIWMRRKHKKTQPGKMMYLSSAMLLIPLG